jgi:hypothetical protein
LLGSMRFLPPDNEPTRRWFRADRKAILSLFGDKHIDEPIIIEFIFNRKITWTDTSSLALWHF